MGLTSRAGVKLWLRVHRWTSLVCTLSLLLACVTGLPLIFSDEFEPAASAALQLRAASVLPLDAIARSRPGVQFVFWPSDSAEIVGLGVERGEDTEPSRLLVSAHDAAALPAPAPPPRWLETLRQLHRDLFLGELGHALLGLMAGMFVLSTLSGVILYGQFMRKLEFGSVRTRFAKHTWLDLHNLIGIATAGWALVVGATGLMNTLEARLFEAWQAEHVPGPAAARASTAWPADSLERALAAAQRAMPEMRVTSIGLAGTRYASASQHLVWMNGASTLEKRLFATVSIDAVSGRVERAEALPWYLRVLEVSRPLHFGDYGGLPMKLLWASFDLLLIAVLVSGLYLWFARGSFVNTGAQGARDARSAPEPAA